MPISVRNKILSVFIATGIFVALALLFSTLLGLNTTQSGVGALLLGLMVSGFEEFYFQSRNGRWLRAIHPLKSIAIYSLIILCMFFAVMHLNHGLFGRWEYLHEAYANLPIITPLLYVVSFSAIILLRVIGFIGARNLFFLITGKYHRPVTENKAFLFLDIRGSTALVERLGPVQARFLIGKFFFDISKPITDNGGEIYRFTGDGVVATWDWNSSITGDQIINAIDSINIAVEEERRFYDTTFGQVPTFRIGVHSGEIITSEEGDTKRAIGYYGDTIHIAARLEQRAKELNVDCLLSENITSTLSGSEERISLKGQELLRGLSKPIRIYELRPTQMIEKHHEG